MRTSFAFNPTAENLQHLKDQPHLLLNVIFENEIFLAVNKPAGLVCHPTKGDEFSSLISRARLYLGPFATPHLVNRLDRETSGVVLIVKNSRHAGEFGKIWERGEVCKEYLAIVHGEVGQSGGSIRASLGKDLNSNVAVKDAVMENGVVAETVYQTVKTFRNPLGSFSLLKVFPRQGRKHQIRIHLQHIGFPIVGDKLYGKDENFYLRFVYDQLSRSDYAALILSYQALHAQTLKIKWRRTDFTFQAGQETWFEQFHRQNL